jgi:hypothetical protein
MLYLCAYSHNSTVQDFLCAFFFVYFHRGESLIIQIMNLLKNQIMNLLKNLDDFEFQISFFKLS